MGFFTLTYNIWRPELMEAMDCQESAVVFFAKEGEILMISTE